MSILSLVLRDPGVSRDFKQVLCNAEHVELYEVDDEPGEDPRIQADRDREIDDRSAA